MPNPSNMKNVLITGAGGFAGSHLVEYLLQDSVYTVYATTYRPNELLSKLLPDKQILQGDLTDLAFTKDAVKQSAPDYVFHLAALSVVHNSVEKAQALLISNISLQHNLLESVRLHAPHARFIAVCSANEYGKVTESDIPIDESTPLKPLNPYAVSKIAQEYLALQYHHSYGLDVVILRPFNHTGERQTDNFLIPSLAKQIAEIEKGKSSALTVGNLEAIRDFTDVKDIVRAYVLAAQKCKSGQIYNIGSGQGQQVQKVLDMLLKLSSTTITVQQDPAKMRPSDVPVLIADSSKFTSLTGWKPEISLDKTLNRVLNYWRKEI